MTQTPEIAIIGGGPAGLTLARLLEVKGISYTVYERDTSPSSNRAGGSLDIHPSTGQNALVEAGLFSEFKKYARYEDTGVVLTDKLGNKVLEMGQGRDAPEIDRAELRKILLESIPEERIKWGYVLKEANVDEDGRPVLKFANGEVLSGFKLIVGADGAWSKVRSLITKAAPKYSGKSFLESRIDRDSPLYETTAKRAGAGMNLSIGSGNLIVTQRQGNGSYRNYFGLQVPEDFFRSGKINLQDIEETRTLLLSDFYGDWAEEYRTLISHATDFRAWPLYTLSTEDMNWRSAPGVALLGDAAHLAITNGEGVNLAMTDALKLANKISEHGIENIDQAVREYEMDMFPRGKETINDGWVMANVMFSEDPQAFFQLMKSYGA